MIQIRCDEMCVRLCVCSLWLPQQPDMNKHHSFIVISSRTARKKNLNFTNDEGKKQVKKTLR